MRCVLSVTLAIPALLLAPAQAWAQLSLSLTAASDYRFRGFSLSEGRPMVSAGLAYDFRGGAYAGASMVVSDPPTRTIRLVSGTVYAGFARRTAGGLTLDVGLVHADFANPSRTLTPGAPTPGAVDPIYGYAPPTEGGGTIDAGAGAVSANAAGGGYSEAYAGVGKGPLSARIYLSPDYFGQGRTTAYLDLNAAVRPSPRLRLFGHGGILAPLDRGVAGQSTRYDVRAGLAVDFPRGEVQLAWTTAWPRRAYLIGYPQDRDAVVLSASAYF